MSICVICGSFKCRQNVVQCRPRVAGYRPRVVHSLKGNSLIQTHAPMQTHVLIQIQSLIQIVILHFIQQYTVEDENYLFPDCPTSSGVNLTGPSEQG